MNEMKSGHENSWLVNEYISMNIKRMKIIQRIRKILQNEKNKMHLQNDILSVVDGGAWYTKMICRRIWKPSFSSLVWKYTERKFAAGGENQNLLFLQRKYKENLPPEAFFQTWWLFTKEIQREVAAGGKFSLYYHSKNHKSWNVCHRSLQVSPGLSRSLRSL